MSLMDPPSPFRFPPRESLQNLSPERVHNRSRPSSIVSSKAASGDIESQYEQPSPRSSPSRKAANLFSDYDPRRNSPVKEMGFALPGSPSLPDVHAFQRTHLRTNSDVQGLVKRFEHLDVRDREAEIAERRKRHEAELSRAQVAREEAESDVKRLREQVRRLKKEGEEGKDRERRVAKRLDVVMDEFTTFKETQTSQLSIYEKEVRKARKEAFKSASVVLKLQEELKSTRNTLRTTHSNLDMERRKVQQKEQQTFDAQYQMVALQDELDKLRTHVKTIEQEKDALKTSLKEEEVARIAAEGMIALPIGTQGDDDLMSPEVVRSRSPRKRQPSPLSDDKENLGVVTKKMVDLKQTTEELRREKMRREQAEELVDFLRMECRFKCCGCRSRRDSVHDDSFTSRPLAEALENIRSGMRSVLTPPASESGETGAVDSAVSMDPNPDHPDPEIKLKIEDVEMVEPGEEVVAHEFECSVTMAGAETPSEHVASEEAVFEDEEPVAEIPSPVALPSRHSRATTPSTSTSHSTTKVPLAPSSPQTPGLIATPARPYGSVRTITTTTTIPMQFTPAKPVATHSVDAETIPLTVMSPQRDRSGSAPAFDREAALAMIAYRRGRAKSIADGQATPRKLEGAVKIKERREVSAPVLGQQKSSSVKRSLSRNYNGKVGSASRTR
ncbi:hypothetical protein CERZMDRAFT_93559 [Cercospora zeae-maydis SCOH1-5]|uniref:Uncharacterized protein n=1 Tax=Cercospora zeae-maydis SCOH1-5 TaxID=717836 RepID=A0A6A6FS34_9PEZI|nr:hypothetical protein CERZMDRAFT_93559 [Cercospora zeae-maydis SCOH1-5]